MNSSFCVNNLINITNYISYIHVNYLRILDLNAYCYDFIN